MLSGWNVETYRDRARQWREETKKWPPGRQYDACVAVAEGYENLVRVIEEELVLGLLAPAREKGGAQSAAR